MTSDWRSSASVGDGRTRVDDGREGGIVDAWSSSWPSRRVGERVGVGEGSAAFCGSLIFLSDLGPVLPCCGPSQTCWLRPRLGLPSGEPLLSRRGPPRPRGRSVMPALDSIRAGGAISLLSRRRESGRTTQHIGRNVRSGRMECSVSVVHRTNDITKYVHVVHTCKDGA